MKLFAGLDVSLEKTAVCIEDDAGKIVWWAPTSAWRRGCTSRERSTTLDT